MKKFILIFFAFAAGVVAHALFFPQFLTTGASLPINHVLGTESSSGKASEKSTLITKVSFRNGTFQPQIAYLKKSAYLAIINDDRNELMWLTSSYKDFNTVRGFGFDEQIMSRIDDAQNFEIVNKNKPDSVLQVVVK